MTTKVFDFQRAPLEELFDEASRRRKRIFGDSVELCAIVNVKSGRCPMDCRFCAQSSRYRTAAPVYPLLDDSRLDRDTRPMHEGGAHRVGWVASGCAVGEHEIADIVRSASSYLDRGGGRLCASLGRLPDPSLKTLREAGISRYHHNLETSERFYPNICTTQSRRDRYRTVRRAKDLGLETCSGGLFGLGETWQDRFELARTLADLQVDSVPVNFISPVPGTPFQTRPILEADEALRIIAMLRILLPQASIRVCGGRPRTLNDRQAELFDAGADAIMTGDYLTTQGISLQTDLELLRGKNLRPGLHGNR